MIKMIIEIDGYYEQVLLSGESCTIKELQRMYWQVKRQAVHALDVPKILVAQYGFTRLPYDESVQVAFVIDTDTDRIYARNY